MADVWRYTYSKGGRHQVSKAGGGNICSMWTGGTNPVKNAELICKAPQMEEYLKELHSRFTKAGFHHEANRIKSIIGDVE